MDIKQKNIKSSKKYLSDPIKHELHKQRCREYCEKNKEIIKQKRDTPEHREKERIRKDTKECREFTKQWLIDNKDILHERRVNKIYNTDYKKLFEQQNSCCKICKTHQDQLNKKLCVDHCHTTNDVRGLLCSKCNAGLGQFNDDT
jgi:hypothetical protein